MEHKTMEDTRCGGRADGHQYVDLGLPSGTLWAACNVGADSPEESGDYFCWGEIQVKTYYDLTTYRFFRQDGLYYEASHSGYDKYVPKASRHLGYHQLADNKAALDPQDDAARMNWGTDWRMPTMAECEELISLCQWEWTVRNGIEGYVVTGPNGNSIFLPAARRRANDVHGVAHDFGQYLSSTLSEDYAAHAKCMYFTADEVVVGNAYRCDGASVRPVFAI